jgi:small subunit ribosomal protein S16
MLAIRMQRTGRSGHSQFRVIIQDSRFSPKRGRIVAYVGSYNPHTKTAEIDTEKISQYLANGAQPSDRVAKLLQKEGVKLPDWVKLEPHQSGSTRNAAKRRSTRPAEAEPVPTDPAADTPATKTPANDAPATDEQNEAVADEAPAEDQTKTEEPAAEPEAPDATEPSETSEEPAQAEAEKSAEAEFTKPEAAKS